MAMDIAAVLRRQLELVDADTVQLDEASIAGIPQDATWAAEAINHVLDGMPNEQAVHICFGNYGGQPMLKGFWRDLIPFLNALHADHLVLEFARRGYDELERVQGPRPEDRPRHRRGRHQGQRSRDARAHRLPDRARSSRPSGASGVRYIHPDCGFWMLQRSVVDRKMRARGRARSSSRAGCDSGICRPCPSPRLTRPASGLLSSRTSRASRLRPRSAPFGNAARSRC